MTDSADARAREIVSGCHHVATPLWLGVPCEPGACVACIADALRAQATQAETANAMRVLAELKLAEASQIIRDQTRDLRARLAAVEEALSRLHADVFTGKLTDPADISAAVLDIFALTPAPPQAAP